MAARVPEALAAVGLAGFEGRATATLSGGEKQRLAIADILAPAPRVLVFDEPTANLDPPGMHDTFARLGAIAEQREHTIVLIEHRLDAALPLADDVLLLDASGRQIAFAPAGEVRRASVDLLRETGAWVPRAWAGAGGSGAAGSGTAGSGAGGSGGGGADARSRRDARDADTPSSADTAVEVRSLDLAYPGDRESPSRALEAVDLRVTAGERVAIVGPNGSGKSTLLLVLAGLLRPTAGAVTIRCGSKLCEPARIPSKRVPETVGLVFQDPELGFVARTARDEVLASAKAAGRQTGGDEAAGVLDAFGLGHLADVEPFRLSQGEQRRLSLAAYALRAPQLLLLDEPTFGLDRRGTDAVFALLDRLRSGGQTQLLATHDPRLLPLCDRVVALDRGRVAFDGSPDRFLAAPPFDPTEPWREGAGFAEAATADVARTPTAAAEGSR